MFVLLFFLLVAVVDGQLSISELFQFHSKYATSGNCTDFHYPFKDVRWKSLIYSGLRFDCNSSSLILESQSLSDSSLLCIKDIEFQQNFRVHFRSSQSIENEFKIEANQLQLYGIELATLDDLIHEIYPDFAYYRSQRALLINFNQNDHFALALNDEMMFLVFVNSAYNDLDSSMISQVDLIFPNQNIFSFNRSQLNVWRVDEGFVINPKIPKTPTNYQLSKTLFQLYSNEKFFIYGTQEFVPRRFQVLIDEIPASCSLNSIFCCTFPVLPSTVNDSHQPELRVVYSRRTILNATLTLRPRERLSHIPTTFSLMNMSAFQVTLDENLCKDKSLRSIFHLIVDLWREDVNGTAHYQQFIDDELPPINCDRTVPIGERVTRIVSAIPLVEILSISVDLIHQWYDRIGCEEQRTRITFL